VRCEKWHKNIYFGFKRTYDDLLIDTSLFHVKTEEGSFISLLQSSSALAGGSLESSVEKNGIRIMVQFNH